MNVYIRVFRRGLINSWKRCGRNEFSFIAMIGSRYKKSHGSSLVRIPGRLEANTD